MRTLSENQWIERLKQYHKLDKEYVEYCEAKKDLNEIPLTYKQWINAEIDIAEILYT